MEGFGDIDSEQADGEYVAHVKMEKNSSAPSQM